MKSSKHIKPIFQGSFFLVLGHKNWNVMEIDFQPTFALCLDNCELEIKLTNCYMKHILFSNRTNIPR